MEGIWHSIQEWVSSNTGAALTIGFLLFIITMILTAMRWIGFSVTFLLLIFILISGVIIANLDAMRKCFENPSTEKVSDIDLKMANFQEQILKSYDSLKAEVEIQKHKVQVLSEEIEHLKKPEPKEINPPSN